jgi:hypothetical protein
LPFARSFFLLPAEEEGEDDDSDPPLTPPKDFLGALAATAFLAQAVLAFVLTIYKKFAMV